MRARGRTEPQPEPRHSGVTAREPLRFWLSFVRPTCCSHPALQFSISPPIPSMRSSLLALLAGVAVAVSVAPSVAASCGIDELDFTSLTHADFVPQTGPYFLFHLCGPLTSDQGQTCATDRHPDSSACLPTGFNSNPVSMMAGLNTGEYDERAAGNWSLLTTPGATGATFTMFGETSCYLQDANQLAQYTTTVQLQCAESESFYPELYSYSCNIGVTIETPLACTPKAKAEMRKAKAKAASSAAAAVKSTHTIIPTKPHQQSTRRHAPQPPVMRRHQRTQMHKKHE